MKKSPCNVRILSFIDGERSVYENKGEYILNGEQTEICYTQDLSKVTLTVFPDGSARMKRTGDCFLDLSFRKNTLTEGGIGLCAAEKGEERGGVPLFTEEIKRNVTTDGKTVSLYLRYIFRFDGGEQKCAVRVLATAEGKS